MSQPVASSPSSIFRSTRPIAAKPIASIGVNISSPSGTTHTMATTGPVTPGNGGNTGASTSAPAAVEAARPQFFQFSAATEMILKRLRGEGGPLSPSSALGMRSGVTTGTAQPPGYEDVRRSVLEGMKTTLNMDLPSAPAKKNPKVAAVARTATPVSVEASASPVSGTGSGKGKAPPRAGRARAGTKRKRAKDESDSADDTGAMSGLGGDSDSDGQGSVTNIPKQTLSGRRVVKPAQFNPAAVEGPTRKRGSYNYKRSGRSVEQALCKRCGRGHSPASNMIVFCDGCNIGWHQMCHDPMVSDELVKDESKEWFCNDCAAKRAKSTASMASTAEVSKDAALLGKNLDEKRAYLSTFSHPHLVSLLLQATIMHPDIPIFAALNPSPPPPVQQAAPRPSPASDRRLNVYTQQPFPPSATSTFGLFTRAEANPNAQINFIRKIQPGPFVTSFDHHYNNNTKPEISTSATTTPNPAAAGFLLQNPASSSFAAPPPPLPPPPTLSQQQQQQQPLLLPNQPPPPSREGQDDQEEEEDAEGEDESRASTPASPPYPKPGNGLMAKLPPDDQDLEWLVGEGEDEVAFSHVVFDAEGEARKVGG